MGQRACISVRAGVAVKTGKAVETVDAEKTVDTADHAAGLAESQKAQCLTDRQLQKKLAQSSHRRGVRVTYVDC